VKHFDRLQRIAVLSTAVALASLGCRGSTAHPELVGDMGLSLTVGTGATVDSVGYAITGPAGFTRSGSIDVSHSSTVSATIGALPAGMGFTIALDAKSKDGAITCAGSATFNVAAGQTTPVTVHLLCHDTPHTGSVFVNGTLNVCPLVDGVSASPAEVQVGGSLSLGVQAHDVDA